MTHWTIAYPVTDADRQRKACLDAIQYCGFKSARRILRLLPHARDARELRLWRMQLAFGGVSGYPTTALFERYVPYYDASNAHDDTFVPRWASCD